LLACIAILPLLWRHWWEKYFPVVSVGLGLATITYYAVFLRRPAAGRVRF